MSDEVTTADVVKEIIERAGWTLGPTYRWPSDPPAPSQPTTYWTARVADFGPAITINYVLPEIQS